MLRWLKRLLMEGTPESSMRAGFLIVTLFTALLMGAFVWVMLQQAHMQPFPGFELAALLGAIYAGWSGAAWFKKEQKRHEKHYHKEDPPDGAS